MILQFKYSTVLVWYRSIPMHVLYIVYMYTKVNLIDFQYQSGLIEYKRSL